MDQAAHPPTLSAAAASGDRRALLVALRDHISATIPTAPAREQSPLIGKLLEVTSELEKLDMAQADEDSVVAHSDDERWDAAAI